jgi:uncharacterized membrane protein YebE (DUF533 family)
MNFDRVLKSLLSSPASAGIAGAVAGGLLASHSGRKLGKKALELGGMAALAGLACKAWQSHQAGSPPAAEPTPAQLRDAGFLPRASRSSANDELDTALFRAMVAAARSDGRLDPAERSALFEQIDKMDLRESERAELYAQLESPVTLADVVASASTPQRALEIYTASRLAIEPDSPAERGYLALLAARLGLDDGLVAEIERGLAADAEPVRARVGVTR